MPISTTACPDGTQVVVTDLSRPGVEVADDVRDQQIYEPVRRYEDVYGDDPYADASRMTARRRRRYLDDEPVYADPYYDGY